jgi:hypothetical protein
MVTDATTTQPMPGVTVVLRNADGHSQGTLTDPNGYFLLGGILPDTYVFKITFVGYTAKIDTLTLNFGDRKIISVALRAEKKDLGQVVVTAKSQDMRAVGSVAGMQLITPNDIARLPSLGVLKDLAQYLVALPGFSAPADRGGQLYVRGGTPTQNQVLIDGIPVYQPFHILGSYSAFSDETIARADVYSGGFGARYGGRIASVVDVASRNGNKQRFAGSAAADPIFSGVRIEGPLKKNDVSFLLSLRQSVVKDIAPTLLKQKIPFDFGDQLLRLHAFITPTSSLSFTGLRTHDEGDLQATDLAPSLNPNRIYWANQAFGGRFFYLPPDFPAILDISLSKSAYQSEFGAAGNPSRFSNVESYRLAMNFDYIMRNWEMRFGLFIRGFHFQYKLAQKTVPDIYSTEGGLFLDAAIPIGKYFHIEPSVRLHTFPKQGQSTIEPRFRAAFYPQGSDHAQRISLAFGQYHQQIVGLADTKDIGEVFFAFAPSGYVVPMATHYIAGYQNKLASWVFMNIEGYYKALKNITSLLGNEGFVISDGFAKGVDVQLRAEKGVLLATANYSLAEVLYSAKTAQNQSIEFHPAHDRRHQVNLTLSYRFKDFLFNARWQYGSGTPFTQFTGFDDVLPLSSQNRNHFTSIGKLQPYYDAPFQAQLPAYNRLDATAEYVYHLKRANLTIFAGAQNIYNRKNLFYFDIEQNKRIDQLPILPSVGLKMEVK